MCIPIVKFLAPPLTPFIGWTDGIRMLRLCESREGQVGDKLSGGGVPPVPFQMDPRRPLFQRTKAGSGGAARLEVKRDETTSRLTADPTPQWKQPRTAAAYRREQSVVPNGREPLLECGACCGPAAHPTDRPTVRPSVPTDLTPTHPNRTASAAGRCGVKSPQLCA